MKLFPVLFRAGAAILSEALDDLAEAAFSVLDGGLDSGNLAAGLALSNAQMQEPRARISCGVTFKSGRTNEAMVLVVPASIASLRLRGWSYSAPAERQVTGSVKQNGVVVASFTPERGRADSGLFAARPAFDAGDVITVLVPGMTTNDPEYGYPSVRIALSFDALHVV